MTADILIQLSRQLLEASRRDYVPAAAEQIRRLLGGDDVCWVQCDWKDDVFVVWRASICARDTAAERILPACYECAGIPTYARTPSDLAPRRLSDLPIQSESNANALRLTQRYIGLHQISMIMNVHSFAAGKGWIVTRGRRDFDDEDLDTATRILPVLYLLDHVHHPDLAGGNAEVPDDLTARERQVIDLLTTGLTAAAIGRVLGISQRTVSKHVENAYRKLGVHDRLLVARDRLPA